MTEAVAYALHCLGQEGLHTSLKPEEGLIYLYDHSTMVIWSRDVSRHGDVYSDLNSSCCICH